jgi:hypothetical protein
MFFSPKMVENSPYQKNSLVGSQAKTTTYGVLRWFVAPLNTKREIPPFWGSMDA